MVTGRKGDRISEIGVSESQTSTGVLVFLSHDLHVMNVFFMPTKEPLVLQTYIRDPVGPQFAQSFN